MELRPRFSYRWGGTAEQAEERLRRALGGGQASCRGRVRHRRLELVLRTESPRFWAPELRAALREGDGATEIVGHFAPRPDVWTMFVAIYATIVFSTGIGAVFGVAQLMLGSAPWALWSLPAGVLLVLAVWCGARLGQGRGARDMELLGDFVKKSLR